MSTFQGTVVADAIVPLGSNATHYDIYGQGGFRSVADLDERNNLSLSAGLDPDGMSSGLRKLGMMVTVADTGKTYQLLVPGFFTLGTETAKLEALGDDANWLEFAGSDADKAYIDAQDAILLAKITAEKLRIDNLVVNAPGALDTLQEIANQLAADGASAAAILAKLNLHTTQIGTMSGLTTTEKSNLVGAINEVKASVPPAPVSTTYVQNSLSPSTTTKAPSVTAVNTGLNLRVLSSDNFDVYDISSTIRTAVVNGVYNANNELQGIVTGSVVGMRFTYLLNNYEYMPGTAGTLTWVRSTKKSSVTLVQNNTTTTTGISAPVLITHAELTTKMAAAQLVADTTYIVTSRPSSALGQAGDVMVRAVSASHVSSHGTLATKVPDYATTSTWAAAKGSGSAYAYSADTYSGYFPYTPTGTVTTAVSGDDNFQIYPLPFPFTFGGVQYTEFGIDTNGRITFESGNFAYGGGSLSTASGVPLIALAWQDFVVPVGGITFFTEGTTPNRELVIQFSGAQQYTDPSKTFTGQVILEETANLVTILTGPTTLTVQASQGIQYEGGAYNTTTTNIPVPNTTTTYYPLPLQTSIPPVVIHAGKTWSSPQGSLTEPGTGGSWVLNPMGDLYGNTLASFDQVLYNAVTDDILERRDNRLNVVAEKATISGFPWGNPKFTSNTLDAVTLDNSLLTAEATFTNNAFVGGSLTNMPLPTGVVFNGNTLRSVALNNYTPVNFTNTTVLNSFDTAVTSYFGKVIINSVDMSTLNSRLGQIDLKQVKPTTTNTSYGLLAGAGGLGITMLGASAGAVNTGNNNTFVGIGSGSANTSASNNAFIGSYAGQANTTGQNNVFLGHFAARNTTTGSSNVMIGSVVAQANTTGANNVFLGFGAGNSNTTGTNNIAIGSGAGPLTATLTNTVSLGTSARATTTNTMLVADSLSTGFGVAAPTSKVHVNGDVETNANFGIVLKSPDGKRWRVKVGNDGVLTTTLLV
ncbi:hypothetical protein I2I05_08505 [Hymenobacter sp. BT683]|uniref:Tail fiber protein n=1 Tax=Hymenobacter jeongseonensis TaxID=2791027 RepID=A0ABS0IGE9_9BACT|nr:hypothetical protein [Hymenobacter jeongseonensis]MBF9237437.1 hypothetical protein [Hymenobacter jeongseonensis]